MSAHKRRLLQNTKPKSLRSLACCIIFLQFPQTLNIVFGIKKKKIVIKSWIWMSLTLNFQTKKDGDDNDHQEKCTICLSEFEIEEDVR